MKTTPKPKYKKCERCFGTGYIIKMVMKEPFPKYCPFCVGIGEIEVKPTKERIEKISDLKTWNGYGIQYKREDGDGITAFALEDKINELIDAYNNR